MNSKITKILVIGELGNGKSTFCNYILDEKRIEIENNIFSIKQFDIRLYVPNHNSKNSDIFVIDTDLDAILKSAKAQVVIDRIRKQLSKEHCNGIKSIIIMFNFKMYKLSLDALRQIAIFCKMFPYPEFWYHVAIAFSFCHEYFPEEELNKLKQEKENKFMKNFMEKVNDITKEINKELSSDKQIKVPGHFQTYYLDCGKVYPPFNHNRTDEEINKLLNWSRNQDYLDIDKNDLNSRLFVDYKSIEQIEDRIDVEEHPISDIEIRCITKYYKQYREIDFDNKDYIITKPNPYKTEIYYIRTEIEEIEEIRTEPIPGNKEQYKRIRVLRRLKIYKKLDQNHNFIDIIKKEERITNRYEEIVTY